MTDAVADYRAAAECAVQREKKRLADEYARKAMADPRGFMFSLYGGIQSIDDYYSRLWNGGFP